MVSTTQEQIMTYKEFMAEQYAKQIALGIEAGCNGATWKELVQLQLLCWREYYAAWWKLTCAKFKELRAQRR